MSEPGDAGAKLSHVDASGRARMVDVTAKPATERMARARGEIRMQAATLTAIRENQAPKGDVLGVARVAGVLAAKRTAELIPLCHSLPLTDVDVAFELDDALPGVRVEAIARTVGRTGVEMEAIVAVSVALITVYDMAKAIDKTMVLGGIELVEKRGGKSGQ
ncbi:MAG: cyclic pyranopterin monophosphate synthase MoaC [Gemmatimonadaceae bacterium]